MVTPVDRIGMDAIAGKGWIGAHRWLILRRLCQVAIIAMFLSGPWAGLWILKGNIASSRLLDTVPMTDPLLFVQMLASGFFGIASTAIIGAVVVAAFYVVVGGRVYCAWVCPMNIVTDAAHWLRRCLGIKSHAQIGRNIRYWMLAMVIVLAAVTGTLAYELVNPVSVLYRGVIFGMGVGWAVIAGIFLFDLFVLQRGWCGHVCPMGAAYGLIGEASLVRVRADRRERCDNCMECFAVCPEPQVISPALRGKDGSSTVIMSGDCTNCGRCIEICPEDVFNFGLRHPASRRPQTSDAPGPGNAEGRGIGKTAPGSFA